MPPKTFEVLQDVTEKGMALFGHPEAKFNQGVKERMKKAGMSESDAQAECLANLARTLQAESAMGVLDKKSKGFQELKGALNVLLDKKEQKQCKTDSESGHYTPKGVAISKDDIENQKWYYEQKYKNYGGQYIPDMRMISRHAQQTKEIEAIATKLSADLASGSLDIATLKAGGNADSADIGKLLALKENMDSVESSHEFRLGGAKVLRAMWDSAVTDITVHMWGDIKNAFASGFRLDPKGLLFSAAKLALWDMPLFLPKMMLRGVLNMVTPRPDRVIK